MTSKPSRQWPSTQGPAIGRCAVRRGAALLALAAAVATGGCTSTAPPAPHTSVVVVVVDTLRADHLGAYGYERPTSPQLDRWAAQARVFERAHATSPWTLPSFGSLYTGLYPVRHGAGMDELGPGTPLGRTRLNAAATPIAEHLRSRGVNTGAVASNPFLGAEFGLHRGFMVYDHEPGDNVVSRRADFVVDRALEFVEQWRDEPFFLLVHLFDPHLNYDAPPPFRDRFSAEYESDLTLPVDDHEEVRNRIDSLSDEDRAFIEAAYDEEVAFVDEHVGRFLDELSARGVLDRTLVVLTSDHGEEFFEHGGFEHGHEMWQELLHIPLLVWGPDVVPGREPAPVSLVDVAPTILDWLDVDPFPAADGISLWPNLSTEAPIPDRTLYAQRVLYGPPRSAVLQWPVKVVVNAAFDPVRVVDLDADPRELEPRATDTAQVLTLAEQLAVLTERVEADAAADATADAEAEPELDEETIERLRSLGYIR